MARKKQQQGSNVIGLAILGALGFGIYQFGIVGNPDRPSASLARPASVASATPSRTTPTPAPAPAPAALDAPRFVNVAELNVRHTPSTSGPLIMTLPRGTQLKVLGRKDGWLLIDVNPTLEGWVSEQLTTTRTPQPSLRPPEPLKASR
ncbi:SH3 domain-containing protein [Devosia lucknowensis]|uniref:SH3 domain-containing protein n=1 Tax=Devosia lucknowensis TaxID=1096929 RepID=A0A1Y6E764_9HYPH|nr:SH3 domain-containing protein [Devosia lucknowensis]SMQ58537.1 SH3 domain-containing protein [Devosia lucknowensis]